MSSLHGENCPGRLGKCILLTSVVITAVLLCYMDELTLNNFSWRSWRSWRAIGNILHNAGNFTERPMLNGTDPHVVNDTGKHLRQSSANETKRVMFWSTWYTRKNWFNFKEDRMGSAPFQSRHCTHRNCFLTSDRSKVNEAHVLLFYFADRFTLPAKRLPHQYYAHFVHEPPGNRKPGSNTFLRKYSGLINVTVNFRHDADLFVPYSAIVPVANNGTPYRSKIPLKNKTKMALWPVGNCHASSKRQDYVKELRKYMSVDIYGGCGPHKCPRSKGMKCLQEWEQTYKFYLSFENNICDDYISEKMFHPMRFELIPVVLGGGNYSWDAPDHSIINARDFNTPKDLAEFLLKLGEDETRYQSYFAWKSQYEMVSGVTLLFCKLCAALHENKFPEQPASTHYEDYWFGKKGERCDNGLIPRMRKAGGW